jgi:hypothetical protein
MITGLILQIAETGKWEGSQFGYQYMFPALL